MLHLLYWLFVFLFGPFEYVSYFLFLAPLSKEKQNFQFWSTQISKPALKFINITEHFQALFISQTLSDKAFWIYDFLLYILQLVKQDLFPYIDLTLLPLVLFSTITVLLCFSIKTMFLIFWKERKVLDQNRP